MKILIFSSRFYPEIGGVQNVVYDLSRNFSQFGNIVDIVSSININDFVKGRIKKFLFGFFFFKRKTKLDDMVNYRVFLSLPRGFLGLLSFPFRFIFSIFYLRHLIRKRKYDIINAHFLDDSLVYFYFATLFKNAPIILNIHGNELHKYSRSKYYSVFFTKIINKSSCIIVNSLYMKTELLKRYPTSIKKEINIIPNGLDISKVAVTVNKNPQNYFLFVGRLDTKKGIEILLKAYDQIASKLKNSLYIIGSGSGSKKDGSLSLSTLSKKYAHNKKIIFLGSLPREKVFEYMRGACYTIFPSLHEPFGIVALESIYSGTPFLASSGGFIDIAKQTSCGVTFKPNNVKSLSQTLMRFDKDTNTRNLLASSCVGAIKFYDIEKVSHAYLTTFEKYAKRTNS